MHTAKKIVFMSRTNLCRYIWATCWLIIYKKNFKLQSVEIKLHVYY